MCLSQQMKNNYSFAFAVILLVILVLSGYVHNRLSDQHQHVGKPEITELNETGPDPGIDNQAEIEQENSRKHLLQFILKSKTTEKTERVKLDQRRLVNWIKNNDYAKARHYLVKKASQAVDANDNVLLGEVMQLLGRVSATEGDLASTEVYLFEALDIFEQNDNQQQVANTQLLIGRMYAKRRQIAKYAGSAYDDLLIARHYLSKGQSYIAKPIIDKSIKKNIELGRSGAVASAFRSLARYYGSQNYYNEEREALANAATYYADSGQGAQAREVLSQMKEKYASLDEVERLQADIEYRLESYESQIKLVRQARDYMKLYSVYQSSGEQGRAWEFRVKASEILSRASKRDLYYRAPDTMALLFDSNKNLAKAENYLAQARQGYLDQNNLDAYRHVLSVEQSLK